MGKVSLARSWASGCGQTIRDHVFASMTGVVIVVLLTLAIFATEYLPAGATRANLQRSFENGALQDDDWPGSDRIRGANQYNDCLLVMMTRLRDSKAASAVAPIVVFADYPVDLRTSECAIARKTVFSEEPRQSFDQRVIFPYGRYVHAYRIPFNALITFLSIDVIRHLYRALAIAILAVAALLHARRLARAIHAHRFRGAVTAGAFVVVATALGAFSGLDLYAQSLTHGPSDILLFAAFAALSLGSARRALPLATTVAVLGSLAFAFDFLHGTIPMLLAIILGCTALRSFEMGERLRIRETVRIASIYLTSIAASLAAKLATLGAFSGMEGVRSFFMQLRFRMNGGDHSLTDIASSLNASIPNIAWDSHMFGTTALVAGFVCAIAALGMTMFGAVPASDRGAALMGSASIAVIFCWYAIFRNHSAEHAGFMVRLLAWPIALGPACLILAGAAWHETRLRSSRTVAS